MKYSLACDTWDNKELESTEFSFSRFIVPHLCNYKGWHGDPSVVIDRYISRYDD
jgi:hypothetical protein